MMNDQIYQALITEIQKKFSKNSVMVGALADILRIEKGAVYRRLRQEVPFTFDEIVNIAKNLNISLDNLAGIKNNKNALFQLQLQNFISPQESDYYSFNSYIKFLRSLNKSDDSETASISNVLPHDLLYGFDHLLKFYLFGWNYHSSADKAKQFHQISITPELSKFFNEYTLEMKNFKKTCYVFDNRVFRFFVDRISYFHSIRLIEKEDVLKIKEDLSSLMDYIEKMALTGQFKETGNAVNIYISDIDINACYTYFESKDIHLSMIRAFILSYITTFDEETFERTKGAINAIIKFSTLITLTNEKQRVLFFEKHRNILNKL